MWHAIEGLCELVLAAIVAVLLVALIGWLPPYGLAIFLICVALHPRFWGQKRKGRGKEPISLVRK